MPAAKHNFTIDQGTTFRFKLIWKDADGVPVDLTGYTGRMEFRAKEHDPTLHMALDTDDGTLILNAEPGAIEGIATHAMTAAISIKKGKYDLELTSADDTRIRLVQGAWTLSQEVTLNE